MEELKFRIQELKDEINTIEIQCQKKLNFGNVPKQNWDEVSQMLIRREKIVKALKCLEDVKSLHYLNKNS